MHNQPASFKLRKGKIKKEKKPFLLRVYELRVVLLNEIDWIGVILHWIYVVLLNGHHFFHSENQFYANQIRKDRNEKSIVMNKFVVYQMCNKYAFKKFQ